MSRRNIILVVLGALLVGAAIFAFRSKSWRGRADGFLTISTNLKPGWQLYSAKDRKPVGLVKDMAPNHVFQDGTTQDGVLILFTDATESWVAHERVKALYVAKP